MPVYGFSYHKLSQTSYCTTDLYLSQGDQVVLDINQGEVLAKVASGPFDEIFLLEEEKVVTSSSEEAENVVLFSRLATEEDLTMSLSNQEFEEKAKSFWSGYVKQLNLEMKLVEVEIFLDRSKYIFYFTAPVRIDFRELVKVLVLKYRTRIELRQIGVRHETQLIGAVGNCGMVCCCKRYLNAFAPVTIRMAKEQNLFLNPSKVSGICGRLLCCLAYEQESYDAFHKESPRLGKRYLTRRGLLKVVRINMFCDTITCTTESGEEVQFSLEEWTSLKPHRPDSRLQHIIDTHRREGHLDLDVEELYEKNFPEQFSVEEFSPENLPLVTGKKPKESKQQIRKNRQPMPLDKNQPSSQKRTRSRKHKTRGEESAQKESSTAKRARKSKSNEKK